jgi:hypothetical protein
MSSTTRLLKLTEEQAFENWSNQTFPKLLSDVSGAELLKRNEVNFIEQGGRVDVTVGARSENSVESRLLAAKKASMLAEGLATAVVAPVAEDAGVGKRQAKALSLLGIFRDKLTGKRKAPDLDPSQENAPKKPKI